jgi:ABC-type nitrate/sulfonate/bicarbonate transport system permease component
MDDRIVKKAKPESPAPAVPQNYRGFALRREISRWKALFFGFLCIAICGGIWWFLTRGEIVENRILNSYILPSPRETFASFPSLWFQRFLTLNIYTSLHRVIFGFAIATAIGIPLGVLAGCYSWTKAFLAPLTIFGRNIPIAALIPLTLYFFGIDEFQKVMFIFIATVAFIVDDTATAIRDVSDRYIDTAYTLGANQWQIISKVIFPLALPNIFNSLRLLFGIAFGYIMLAEVIKTSDGSGGLGYIITASQREGPRAHIILVLLIIPIVALAIDRILFWIQRELFPHQYGGYGILRRAVGFYFRCWEDFKAMFRNPVDYNAANPSHIAAAPNNAGD